ncbi:MAG TPA: transcriptional regulator [Phycisphaerales bacterium]|nr:transcriptional regulator [Phycisphaerales bacterium]
MQVPLLDLKAQYATIRDEVVSAVTEVLESQLVCNGPAVRELERQMAEYCQCAAALGVSSGTDALLVSLMALGIGQDLPACRTGGKCPGSPEVITTPFTFFGTAGSIWRAGAKPVFADIDPETFNLDPAAVERAITGRTVAIMPVHLYGQVAEMDALLDIARRHGLKVIEDAAQAIGAQYKGKPAGAFGDCGCFSFYPTKNLGAMGDAGMITTQDKDLAARMEKLRNHGQSRQYFHDWVGGNFRMDSIQGAALSVKMRYIERWTERRRANAERYNELLADVSQVVTPVARPHCRHIYHQYVLRAERRDELQAHLKDRGVASAVYYPLGLHLQDCFKGLGYRKGDFPQTEKACDEVLAMPIYPELTDAQIDYVAGQIAAFYA